MIEYEHTFSPKNWICWPLAMSIIQNCGPNFMICFSYLCFLTGSWGWQTGFRRALQVRFAWRCWLFFLAVFFWPYYAHQSSSNVHPCVLSMFHFVVQSGSVVPPQSFGIWPKRTWHQPTESVEQPRKQTTKHAETKQQATYKQTTQTTTHYRQLQTNYTNLQQRKRPQQQQLQSIQTATNKLKQILHTTTNEFQTCTTHYTKPLNKQQTTRNIYTQQKTINQLQTPTNNYKNTTKHYEQLHNTIHKQPSVCVCPPSVVRHRAMTKHPSGREVNLEKNRNKEGRMCFSWFCFVFSLVVLELVLVSRWIFARECFPKYPPNIFSIRQHPSLVDFL